MIFGKIDYINLLPFYVFLKKEIKSLRTKQMIEHKKSYPSNINRKFRKRLIEAAFISSIESKKYKCLKIGIIAKREVKSVIIKKSDKIKEDDHSATSNVLAKVLNLKGEVLIGDKALKAYLENPSLYIDLAKEWHDKTNLPFVFARLCFHKKRRLYASLSKKFLRRRIKIPTYILKKYSKKREIERREILDYLKLIDYKIDYKSEKSLKIFFKKALK